MIMMKFANCSTDRGKSKPDGNAVLTRMSNHLSITTTTGQTLYHHHICELNCNVKTALKYRLKRST